MTARGCTGYLSLSPLPPIHTHLHQPHVLVDEQVEGEEGEEQRRLRGVPRSRQLYRQGGCIVHIGLLLGEADVPHLHGGMEIV